ncbi:MAG: TGS domain-containing protein, partial [Candidatus Cloacimonetes bacterium]|nr:TGS domain-containing protein [Candidatus Cloacimonadota bacterium]
MSVIISLPDGSKREYPAAISALQVAMDISPRLADAALAAEINGKMSDFGTIIESDAELTIHTFRTEQGKELYWHSTAHLMAQAVKQLWPEVQVTIGPAIEQGFYYDFDREEAFSDEDLQKIEARMKELSAQDLPYHRKELSRDEAIDIFRGMNENYKIEILREIPEDQVISTYTQGDFIDLCRGPHISSTGKIKAVKLLKSSGAYWRGDEKNKMLKRIYGISFPTNKELKEYLNFLEEAA